MWRCVHRLEMFPLLKSRSQPKCFSLQVEVLSPKKHTGMTKCPFLLKGNALRYLCQLKNGGSQETSGGFDLKLSYLWNIPFGACDCHLLKKQFLQVIQLVTPLSPSWRCLLRSLLCASTNQSVTAAELLPPTSPAWLRQWCLHPRKGPEGWLKIRVTFLFDMSKSFIPSFLQHYFSATFQWKIALMVLFSFSQLASFLFLLSVAVYNKAFYII